MDDDDAMERPTVELTDGARPPRRAPLDSRQLAIDTVLSRRYRIVRFLARGGMGEVYEAIDLELGVPIALKMLRPLVGTVSAAAIRRFKREVLLARSIAHPGVCRIYDLGSHEHGDSTYYLTMELLRGETLSRRLRSRGRLSARDAMPVVRQLCEALSAAHHAGVIHRDFKSPNIMIVPRDGGGERVVVTDFGLARARLDDEAAMEERERRVLGTPGYISPEQLRGEEAGPASDLYALGVVLYEMVTGTLPFRGETPTETALLRLERSPTPPRELTPDLDPLWQDAILRLLARDPASRFDGAAAIPAALIGETRAGVRGSLPAERNAFVGREAELVALDRLAGGAGLITLVGVAGVGKSRLLLRFAATNPARWPGGVWLADLSAAHRAEDVATTLASRLDVPLRANAEAQLGHALASLGRCLVILDNFDHARLPARAMLGEWIDRAREATFAVTCRERVALDHEAVTTIEPLHSAEAIALFRARVGEQRAGVGAVDDDDGLTPLMRLLDGLPLAIELAAARARLMTTGQLVDRLSGGLQLLRGGRGRHSSLEAAIAVSWEPLAPWERETLLQVAVFEGGFTLEAAESVLDLTASPDAPWPIDVLQSLADKSLLRIQVPDQSSGPRFSMYATLQAFARERLREAAPATRREAEIRHGAYFATMGGDDALQALNTHDGPARRRVLSRELENLTAACRRAVARGDSATATLTFHPAWAIWVTRGPFATAVELGEAITAMPELAPTDRVRLLIALARAHRLAGDNATALERLERGLAIAMSVGDRQGEAMAYRILGMVHRDQGHLAAVRVDLGRVLDLASECGDERLLAESMWGLGIADIDAGDFPSARTQLLGALQIVRALGDRLLESSILVTLGIGAVESGDLASGQEHYERALEIAREIGDRRGEAAILGNLANLLSDRGEVELALVRNREALTIARALGDRSLEGDFVGNIGNRLLELGRTEEAGAHYERALSIYRETRSLRNEGHVLLSLSGVARARDDLAAAKELQRQALRHASDMGERRFEGIVWRRLAETCSLRGELDEARAAIGRADELLRAVGNRTELAVLDCVRARVATAIGDHPTATAALAAAEQAMLELDAGMNPRSPLGIELAAARAALARRPADPGL